MGVGVVFEFIFVILNIRVLTAWTLVLVLGVGDVTAWTHPRALGCHAIPLKDRALLGFFMLGFFVLGFFVLGFFVLCLHLRLTHVAYAELPSYQLFSCVPFFLPLQF